MGDGRQELRWEWEWVYDYHPRTKGERRGVVVVQGPTMRLPGWHSAGEVSCEAETRRSEVGGRQRRSSNGPGCLSLKTRESRQYAEAEEEKAARKP